MKNQSHSPATIFILTYSAMTFRRSALEIWSLSKSHVEQDLGFTSVILGALDTSYLISYAFGEYINGYLCDFVSESKIMSLGLLTAGICLITMAGLSYITVSSVALFVSLWLIEGYAHSAVLPSGVSLMSSYFPAKTRGKIMGLWGSAASAGNLLGIILYISLEEELHVPWTETLALSGILIILISLSISYVFRTKAQPESSSGADPLILSPPKPARAGLFAAWKIPGVLLYTISYSCCKFMNYAWMMWLPYYLETSLNLSHFYIGLSTASYEIGSVVGTFGGGWISDLVHSRIGTVQVMLSFVSPLAFTLWNLDNTSPVLIICVCFGLGLSVAGVCYLVNCSAAADISASGQQIGAISGVMDGTASLFTGIGIFFVGSIQQVSWLWVFVAICVADFVAITSIQLIDLKKAKT